MTSNEKFAYVLGQKHLIDKIKADLNKILDEVNDGKIKETHDLMFDVMNLLKNLKAIDPNKEESIGKENLRSTTRDTK